MQRVVHGVGAQQRDHVNAVRDDSYGCIHKAEPDEVDMHLDIPAHSNLFLILPHSVRRADRDAYRDRDRSRDRSRDSNRDRGKGCSYKKTFSATKCIAVAGISFNGTITCQNSRGTHLLEGGCSGGEVATGCYVAQHVGHCLHCLVSTANVLPATHSPLRVAKALITLLPALLTGKRIRQL